MANTSPSPKLQFFSSNGAPLSGGKLYTYQAGTTTPLATYTDSSGGVANTNPVILDSRGEASVWLNLTNNYKFKLADSTDVEIWTVDNLSAPLSAASINASSGSSLVGYIRGEAGAVAHTVQDKLRESVSVFDFMTSAQISGVQAGSYTGDLSDAFEAAINTSKRVYVPKGKYYVNVQIDSKTIIEGDGSQSTILYPYDDAVAIMTYTFTAQQTPAYAFWDYHSEIHGIGFWGKTAKTGVGFTFGATVPANYAANMEYADNVKFFGCRFYRLAKGVQFPFGNIGTEFYSCGFNGNQYGAYLLDAKFGGTMHAGNKYWYAGEFSSNDVGVYVNNVTDGWGAIEFKDTIFENNQCAGYFYVTPKPFVPIKFDSVWFEKNGSLSAGGATVTVDTWTGTTQGTTTLNKKTLFFDGSSGYVQLNNSFATDIRVLGTQYAVHLNNCRVERLSGYGGGEMVVDNPSESYIRMDSPYTDGGFPVGPNVYAVGTPRPTSLTITNTSTNRRAVFANPRSGKVNSYGPSLIAALSMTSPVQLTGSATVNGTIVADGRIFPTCNEFTRATFLASEFLGVNSPTASCALSTAGYYVATVDVKVTAGNPSFYVWDRSTAQFITAMTVPETNRWYTIAGIGYNSGTGQTIFFDARGDGNTCTWRASAYQIHRFDSLSQAQMFLESGAYAMRQTPITIASAATIYAPQDMDFIPISGTTGITSIDATGQSGRRITLKFADALTVTDGSNLKLNGNFVTTADDTLTLTCDGTNWYEVSRSAN